jgi:hypothetical protein
MPADATVREILLLIGVPGIQSVVVFHGYAVLFPVPATTRI